MSKRSFCRNAMTAALVLALSACGRGDPASFVASAQKYLAKADYPAAIIELKNALKADPNRAEARFLLATALLDSGNPRDAETEARKALELKYPADEALPLLLRTLLLEGEYRKVVAEPFDRQATGLTARADIDTLRALAYVALGDGKEAHSALASALAADPSSVRAKIAQVRLALAENKLPEALALANAILASNPNEIETLILKSDAQIASGAADEGITTLQRAVALKADSAQARWALLIALVKAGRAKEAEPHLAELKKLAPDHPRTWYSEALLAYSQGKMTAARTAVDRAKNLAPDDVQALYLSGLIDLRQESYVAAEGALRAVVTKRPDDEGARRALATTLMHRGKSALALETLEPLLRRSPNDPSLLRAVAEIHLASNNPIKAVEYFARANKLDPGNLAGRIRLAQAKLATGDYAQAIKDLEVISASEPVAAEGDIALINAHLQRRNFEKAFAAVAALEKKQPSSAVTYDVKGVVYMGRGDYKNARASFDKAASLDPAYIAAGLNLARLDIIERNYDGARARYQQMLVKEPENGPVLMALAELLVATKAPPGEVRPAIGRAITANPSSDRPWMLLINYNKQLRDWNAAVVAAKKAQWTLPDNPQIAEALGTAQFAAGETNQAIASFRQAVQMQPDNPIALIRLAEMLAKIKDYDGSIDSLRTAMDLQPDLPGVWVALALVYADAGRIETGIVDARRVQQKRAERAAGFALEGELQARQKKWRESASAYRAALTRLPTPFLIGRLHSVLWAAGKTDEADAVAQQWIKDHPTDVTVRAYLAEQSMNRNDNRAAAAQLLRALEYEPDNATLLNNLGWVLNELGDPKALEYATRAYAQAPTSALAADTYGWVLVQRGDTARGNELLRQAVELEPNDTGMRLRLARGLLKAGNKDEAKKELGIVVKAEGSPAVRAEAEKLLKEQ